jgi:UDP-N-acetylmuramoylalanine--D-glutamate ligase
VRGDLDLAVEAATVPVVAVTGTNGKSTVTALVSAMLERSGLRAPALGNIGRVVLAALAEPADVLVIEASSFQLHTVTPAFAPDVSVLLNLADDHLDWHGSFDSYVGDKVHVFAYQGPDGLLVANRDDPVVMRAVRDAPGRVVWFGLGEPVPGSAGWRGDLLVADDGTELLTAAGPWAPHDRANIAAAALAARAVGARPAAMGAAVGDFVRLHHRTESVGKAGGVEFVDDSKATNPHATAAAVQGYPSVVLLAGGLSKGVDLGVLTTVRDHLRAVVAIGGTPEEVESAFAGVVPTVRAESMGAAVRAAAGLAAPGDVVLLSPACASFDWYDGYAARGDDFRREVEALLEEGGA